MQPGFGRIPPTDQTSHQYFQVRYYAERE
jgi:hypothetical protein